MPIGTVLSLLNRENLQPYLEAHFATVCSGSRFLLTSLQLPLYWNLWEFTQIRLSALTWQKSSLLEQIRLIECAENVN